MIEHLNLKKGDVLAITGSCGKTTLLFSLAEKLKSRGRVLVTTTTKIFIPKKDEYDSMFIGEMDFSSIKDNTVTVYGHSIHGDKIVGWNPSFLKTISKYFDYILIEADGSMGKPLKGWNDDEPQIPLFVTKTIALVNPKVLGEKIDETMVHRLPLFQEQFNKNSEEYVSLEIFSKYINSNHLFKGHCGERFYFFNQIEDLNSFEKFFNIANNIDVEGTILWGSLHEKKVYNFKSIAVAILASGFSKRMGEDKLNILLTNNKTILENTLDTIESINFKEKFLISRENKFKDIAKKYFLRYLNNSFAHLGQSEGVKLAVNSCSSQGIIFIPGDMPLLQKETILQLLYKFQINDKIIVSKLGEELVAPMVFPIKYREEFNDLTGDSGGRKLLTKHPFITVDFLDKKQFLDVDTPEDLIRIQQLLEEK
ncbi:selenium cofactor biosynthesis protein YqeC [Cetobacterium sp. SF1]|uniref:selenium cofactor biosynthesis protein YqeC n=1 Tax=Cetobacterium sp. SF1 TaxID=3417654 RepID=UPI003CE9AA82